MCVLQVVLVGQNTVGSWRGQPDALEARCSPKITVQRDAEVDWRGRLGLNEVADDSGSDDDSESADCRCRAESGHLVNIEPFALGEPVRISSCQVKVGRETGG